MGKEPNSVPLPRARHRGQEPSSSSWCSLWTSGSTWGLEWGQPWLKKELRAPRAALAGHTESSAQAHSCPDLWGFPVFAERFCPLHTVGLTPPSMGRTNSAIRKGLQIPGRQKKHSKRTEFVFLPKNQGKKRRKKWDRKSLFSFFFFKMCTVSENTENQSHFEHKTKGMRE